MRAAVFYGQGHIAVEERPLPSLRAGDVMVKVMLCALCGSDKRLLDGGATVTPGHEIAGCIASIGRDVDSVAVGDPVVVYIPLFCGSCPACRQGSTNRCANLCDLVGWQADGGFQEYVALPAGNVIQVPAGVDLCAALLVLDTVGTAAHGLRSSFGILGAAAARVAVIGCGPLGLGSAIVAGALGAKDVCVDDVQPSRVTAAMGLGFDRIASGGGRFPVVVEASGSSSGRDRAMTLVEAGGVVLLLGEGGQPWVVPATPAWRRLEAAYLRSFYFPLSEVTDNWKLLRECEERLVTLLDDVRPLSSLSRIFEDFVAGRSVKPVVAVAS